MEPTARVSCGLLFGQRTYARNEQDDTMWFSTRQPHTTDVPGYESVTWRRGAFTTIPCLAYHIWNPLTVVAGVMLATFIGTFLASPLQNVSVAAVGCTVTPSYVVEEGDDEAERLR